MTLIVRGEGQRFSVSKTQLLEVQFVDKYVDYPYRVVLSDVIVQRLWK